MVWGFAEQQEETLIDHLVSEEMDYLIGQYRINSDIEPHRTENLFGYIAHNKKDRKHVPELLRDLEPGFHEVYPSSGELHVVVRDFDNTRFYLTYDVSYHERRISEFEWLIFSFFVLVAIISIGLGYYFSGLLIKPVSDLANRVDDLRIENTSSPLAERYHEDEVVRLASAIDNYVSRIKELMDREKSFTADVSHELRTPLTSIRTSCELLLHDKNISDKSHKRVQQIHRASERMREMISSLLYLARGTDPNVTENIVLVNVIKTVLDPLSESIDEKKLRIDINIDSDETVQVNSDALKVVLSNLLENAIEHTANGKITVQYQPTVLSIIDTGEGISEQDLHLIYNRFYRGKHTSHKISGFGLGLSIVKRLSDYYGWNIQIKSESGMGTSAQLTL